MYNNLIMISIWFLALLWWSVMWAIVITWCQSLWTFYILIFFSPKLLIQVESNLAGMVPGKRRFRFPPHVFIHQCNDSKIIKRLLKEKSYINIMFHSYCMYVKIKWKATGETVPKSKWKIMETDAKSIPWTHMTTYFLVWYWHFNRKWQS